MKYALDKQNDVMNSVADRSQLKNRFKKKFPMSHPLVECLFYKEVLSYLITLGFVHMEDIDAIKLDNAKYLLMLPHSKPIEKEKNSRPSSKIIKPHSNTP